LHKHHLIIRVGAGLIQFVYGSHSRLAADLTLDKNLFSLPFSRGFSPRKHNIQCLPNISFEEPTPVGATSKTGKCVAVVLWIGGQSWQQSLYVMGPGVLQTLSWVQAY